MRVSTYVIGAPLPDQPFYILMHGFTGAVDKVPIDLGQYLVVNRGNECDPPNDVLARYEEDILARLETRGYLTQLDRDAERSILIRIAAALHEHDITHSPAAFILVPTYTCNLRCPYCFQAHSMHAGKGHFSTVMSRERVDQAFAIIDRFSCSGAIAAALGLATADAQPAAHPGGSITLYGGEPLSEASLPIIPYIVEQAVQRGRGVSAISNGVQLDKFANLLGPGLIQELQITLDGLAELHDQRRIGPGFRQTFATVVANIEMALQRGVYVSVRLNIDSTNIKNIEDLDRFFTANGWYDEAGFMAYAAAVHAERPNPKAISQAQLVQITSDLRMSHGARIDSYERWASDTLKRCLSAEAYPFQRVAHCASETGLLIFDPLGDVYACWEEVGQVQHRIATYNEHGIAFDSQRRAVPVMRGKRPIPSSPRHASPSSSFSRKRWLRPIPTSNRRSCTLVQQNPTRT